MCVNMSDVRLSNASPTLERVDARQPDSARPAVRRCLFGSPDRAEVRDVYQATLQGEEQRFRDTYNFDPVEDRPLSPRRYSWELDEDAPEFYRRAPHGRSSQRGQEETGQRTQEERGQRGQEERGQRGQEETGQRTQEERGQRSQKQRGQRDQEQAAQGQTAETTRSRKRPSDPSGSSCSSAPPGKGRRSDEEDEADDGSCIQAAQVPEQVPVQVPEHQ